MTNRPSISWRSVNPAYLVLALLPWLVLAVDSSWIYNALTGVDQWFYFGYFLHYPNYATHLYPDLYYGTRLSWILPGYILHQLFDPVTARYILHVGFYYLAAFSLYGLLRRAVGQRLALLAAVLLGTHSYFLGAIGWDYVDGPGITYNLLALYCIARAATSRRSWLWLTASGAAAAGMFCCNAFLIVFLPFPPALYLYQTYQGFTTASLRGFIRFVLWFGAGALLLTLMLGTVNYAVGANFWFYGPTFDFIATNSSKPNQWFAPGWTWARRATWLALPLTVAIGSIAFLLFNLRRRTFFARDLSLFFVLQYLGCFGIMVAWHFSGGLGLEEFFYTSYLLPSAFLALGSIISAPFERWHAFSYWSFLAGVLVVFIGRFIGVPGGVSTLVHAAGWLSFSLCIGITLFLNVLLRARWQLLLLILAGLWLYQTHLELPFAEREQRSKEILLRMMDSLKLVEKHTAEDPLWFWYNSKGRFGNEFNSINAAYLWSWALVSPDFPRTWPQHPLKPGTEGVILSSDTDALAQANVALKPLRLQARSLATEKVNRDGASYQLFFFRAEPLGTREEQVPLELSPAPSAPNQFLLAPAVAEAPFQRDRWSLINYTKQDSHFELRPDGVHVTTHYEPYSYGAKYSPLVAGKSGFYRFVLEYQDLNGGFQFGCLSPDEKRWLALAPGAIGHALKGVRQAYVELAAGDRVVPMVANYRLYGSGRSSSFVIKSFRAYGAFEK